MMAFGCSVEQYLRIFPLVPEKAKTITAAFVFGCERKT
jgi:hypothetical protein